ncbi:single-stranded DNA-binding protein, partial [Streptomyces sp. NPDC005900]
YEDREGVKRTLYELDVEEVGPSLRSATAKVTKVSGGAGGGRPQGERQVAGSGDPWTRSSQQAGQGGGSGWGEEPPF